MEDIPFKVKVLNQAVWWEFSFSTEKFLSLIIPPGTRSQQSASSEMEALLVRVLANNTANRTVKLPKSWF